MRKLKKDIRVWIIIGCNIFVFLFAWIIADAYNGDSFKTIMGFLVFHLFVFAGSLDTAFIDEILHEFPASGFGNRTTHAPRLIRKIYLPYRDQSIEIHWTVLIVQCATIVTTLTSVLFSAVRIWDYLNEKALFSVAFYDRVTLVLFLITLGIQSIFGFFSIFVAARYERLEAKRNPRKKGISFAESRKLFRDANDRAWQYELIQNLQKNCFKYQKKDYLPQEDMEKIEQRILMPYSKYIVFEIKTDEKGKRILTIHAKSDGELIFQVPIRKRR